MREIPSAQVVLQNFLAAFAQLRLAAMMDCFADGATAFFPIVHQRERLVGKAALHEAFAQVIARVRATGATELTLAAEDVLVQEYGAVAVVTFHMRGEHLSRRTFVLQRTDDEWRIVHFHGSNAP